MLYEVITHHILAVQQPGTDVYGVAALADTDFQGNHRRSIPLVRRQVATDLVHHILDAAAIGVHHQRCDLTV